MRLNDIPLVMVRCLLLTVAAEGLLSLAFRVRTGKEQAIILLANVLTNPLVVSLSYAAAFFLGTGAYYPAMAVLEVAAVTVEALLYRKMLPAQRHPFWLSLGLNAGSFLAGLAWNYFSAVL